MFQPIVKTLPPNLFREFVRHISEHSILDPTQINPQHAYFVCIMCGKTDPGFFEDVLTMKTFKCLFKNCTYPSFRSVCSSCSTFFSDFVDNRIEPHSNHISNHIAKNNDNTNDSSDDSSMLYQLHKHIPGPTCCSLSYIHALFCLKTDKSRADSVLEKNIKSLFPIKDSECELPQNLDTLRMLQKLVYSKDQKTKFIAKKFIAKKTSTCCSKEEKDNLDYDYGKLSEFEDIISEAKSIGLNYNPKYNSFSGYNSGELTCRLRAVCRNEKKYDELLKDLATKSKRAEKTKNIKEVLNIKPHAWFDQFDSVYDVSEVRELFGDEFKDCRNLFGDILTHLEITESLIPTIVYYINYLTKKNSNVHVLKLEDLEDFPPIPSTTPQTQTTSLSSPSLTPQSTPAQPVTVEKDEKKTSDTRTNNAKPSNKKSKKKWNLVTSEFFC